MNNWHLLLLALLATFQPIKSFTESNLVDGRQKCCGREPDFFRQDSKLSLYGPQHFQDLPSDQRLTYRDESRENRHLELTQQQNLYRSTDRSLLNNRQRTLERSISVTGSFAQAVYRPETITDRENRERRLIIQQRQRNVDREIQYDKQSGRILNRITRYSVMRRIDRTSVLSERSSSRISRYSNGYKVENIRSQNERMQTRSEYPRRLTLIRDARDNLRQTREDVVRIYGLKVSATNDNRRHITRERENTVRHSLLQDDARRYYTNNNNKELRQQVQLSGNSRVLERVIDMRMRVSSQNERQERRNRIVDSQLLVSKRIEGRRNDPRQNREELMERLPMDRRHVRENRNLDDMYIRTNRAIERPLEERLSRETRGNRVAQENHINARVSGRTLLAERHNRMSDRRTRSMEVRNHRDLSTETDPNMRRSVETILRRDDSRIFRQVEYQNNLESIVREKIDTRSRNVDSTRTHDLVDKAGRENQGVALILYTLQVAYFCCLLVQMLSSNRREKSNKLKLRWWPLSSQELVKVD